MQRVFRTCATVALLVSGLGVAAAQTGALTPAVDETVGSTNPAQKLELTPQQRAAIFQAVRQENKKFNVPAEMQPVVGAQAPASMELYILPDRALMAAPAAKGFKYTMVQNHVVLVDPTNMRVVDVIDG